MRRAVLILSVSYVALQSTVYSLLDQMVIDRLNEEAIELTSAVGPVKTGSPIIQKKNVPNCACYLCSGTMHAVQKKNHSVPPSRKDKDTPVLCATLRQGHADLSIVQVCLHFSICAATDGQNATSSLVTSLQVTPIHSHSSSSSNRSSRKEVRT